MNNLSHIAMLAEIFSALAIVLGAGYAAVQYFAFRTLRRDQAAAELCRRFSEPDLARAVIQLFRLPDGLPAEEFRKQGQEYEEAAQIVGVTFETMGLLVYRDIASFTLVQEMSGGLLQALWRKMGPWVHGVREETGNPRFGEWVQWLAERLQEREEEIEPAFAAHRDWSHYNS